MASQWFPSFTLRRRNQASTGEASGTTDTANVKSKSAARTVDDERDTADLPAENGGSGSGARHLTLMSLPAEIHVQIVQQLIYPDALSLKHTSRYFYNFVYTGVKLKVEWLMSRRRLHLDCPDTRCDLGSDLRFCRGSVPLLMKHRREHLECESRPGLGCLVYGTKTCTHRRPQHVFQRWLRRRLTVEVWLLLLALVPLVVSWIWFAELFRSYLA